MDQQASDSDDRTEIPLNQGFRLKAFTILPDQRLVISPSGEETKLCLLYTSDAADDDYTV